MRGLVPDQIASKLRYVLYAGAIALAFWALSTFFVSLDQIQSPILSAIYALLVLVPVIGAGAYFLWRSKRSGVARGAVRKAPKPRPSADKRIERLAKALELDDRPPIARPDRAPGSIARVPSSQASRQMTVAVLGAPGVGTSSLIRALQTPRDDNRPVLKVLLRDIPIAELGQDDLAAADCVMLVLDQDIRSYEYAAIEPVLESDKPLVIVLNKADLFSKQTREETLQSIRNRLGDAVGEELIVTASGDPMPRLQSVVHPDGREEEREVHVSPDVSEVRAAFERLARANGLSSIAISTA